jgi:ABC-type dipeptide/oligopeptide/nickel transport system permease component
MLRFIRDRIIHGFLILLGVITVTFLLFQSIGDPIDLMLGHRSDVSTKESLIREYGFDKPLYMQYFYYLNDVSPLSFYEGTEVNAAKYKYTELLTLGNSVMVWKFPYLRNSFRTNKAVTEIIKERSVGTFWLAFTAMTFATVVGVTLGVIAALKKGSWLDHFLVSGSVLGISAPSYVAGSLIAYVLAIKWHDWTGLNPYGYLWELDAFTGYQLTMKNLILPAFTLGIRPLAVIVQLTRSSMLEVMNQDYIRTAISKGLSPTQVVLRHALRNALNPVISAISGWVGSLMAGTLFIEMVFAWKGLGSELLAGVLALDLPVVMGITIFVAIVLVFINLVVDIIYGIVDPRIRVNG